MFKMSWKGWVIEEFLWEVLSLHNSNFLYADEDNYESYIIVIVAQKPGRKEPIILYLGQEQGMEMSVTVWELKIQSKFEKQT